MKKVILSTVHFILSHTGMLLEMDVRDLQELLQQPDNLKKKVKLAIQVLQQETNAKEAPS